MRSTGINSVLEMQQPELQHPTEETLENFLLHRMQEEELDTTETHILACDSCVARLEAMDIQLEATKMALAEFHQETVEKNYAADAAKNTRWSWLKLPTLSLAGAGAALAIALTIAPHFAPVERTVNAVMGSEVTAVPANRQLLLHLNAKDLREEAVAVQVVNSDGNELWKGNGTIHNSTVDTRLPKFNEKGNYLVRLYSKVDNASTQGNLLREYSLAVE
jgi:anti-sigma factor RsiW